MVGFSRKKELTKSFSAVRMNEAIDAAHDKIEKYLKTEPVANRREILDIVLGNRRDPETALGSHYGQDAARDIIRGLNRAHILDAGGHVDTFVQIAASHSPATEHNKRAAPQRILALTS